MAGATVTIEGKSDVGAVVSADLAKASDGLKKIESSATGSVSPLNAVNGALSAVSAIAAAGGILASATALYELGAAASEAGSALNAMTGGGADQYIKAIALESDGMISKFDAAKISNRALNYGLELSADQMGQLAKAAATLGDVTGKSTTEAMDLLTDAIGRGNTRMLAQLGIVSKGKDMTAEVNALMASNTSLTFTQASQIAALNAVLARSNELQLQGVGVQRSAADSAERLEASWKNLTTAIGQNLAAGVQPAVDGANNLVGGINNVNDAIAEERQRLMDSTTTWDDYVAKASVVPFLNTEVARSAGAQTESYMKLKAAWEENRRAVLDHASALATNTRDAEAAMNVQRQQVVTAAEMLNQTNELSAAINQYNAEIQAQASGVLTLLQNHSQLNDAWAMGQAALQQADLTATETLALYEQLGLATGKLSVAQIEAANVGQQLNNMWVAGTLSTEAYAQAVNSLTAGANANAIAHQAQANALNSLAANLMAQGVPAMDAYARAQQQVKASADGTTQTAAQLETMIANYNNALATMQQPEMVQFREQGGDELTGKLTTIKGGLDAINGTPATAQINANTEGAERGVARAQELMASIKDKTVYLTVDLIDNTGGGGPAAPEGKAVGGPVFAGQGYIVGERGPEFFMPNVNGTIVPNNQISTISGASGGSSGPSGGGATYVTLNAYGVNDPIELVQMIDRELTAQGRAFARAT